MSQLKPDYIETLVWEKTRLTQEWEIIILSRHKRISECLIYSLCCQIYDDEKFDSKPRYFVLHLMDTVNKNIWMSKNGLSIDENEIVHMYDYMMKKFLKIRIHSDFNKDITVEDPNGRAITLDFFYDGTIAQWTSVLLNKTQRQGCSDSIIKYANGLMISGEYSQYLESVDSGFNKKTVLGPKFKDLLESNSNYHICSTTDYENKSAGKLRGENWEYLKVLPVFDLNEGCQESYWKHFLVGTESLPHTSLYDSDHVVLSTYFQQIKGFEIIRTGSGTDGVDETESVMASVRQFLETGNLRRTKERCDNKSFGIGIKNKKRAQKSLADLKEWKRAEFPVENRSMPTWIEEELENLETYTSNNWLNLDDNAVYNEYDRTGEKLCNQYLSCIDHLYCSAMVEKTQVASGRVYQEVHTDRSKITMAPIITRKNSDDGTKTSQFWGIILIGEHHVKHESDRIPLVTLEFVSKDNRQKYPKHNFGRFVVKDTNLSKDNDIFHFLVKITSVSKVRLHIMSNIRRVCLQPGSIYSKVLLEHFAAESGMNSSFNPTITLYYNQGKRDLDLDIWIRKIYCLEYLMATHNDSQMEGFLANIRRLHMVRQALMENKSVSTPKGGDPGSKVQECIKNNPIVLYLASGWNVMPNVYG
uniref:RNA-dependent RNA polymerase subunit PA n=1 Tax=Xiangshan orthomyxo-like virus TaxID=2886237 RepID=A0A8K1P3H6_9ORTO|nr:MAG: RNA-dependent RNA polymerase subunit PA [Xiangshan orthomyxo-like virus]